MAYIPIVPIKKSPNVVTTSNRLDDQVWRELVILRYIKSRIAAKKSIAPWIDQANVYYRDASKSDWRSGGLLYYYSFLNLAKALLVAKRKFTYKSLNITQIHHGLSSDLQQINNICDYKIKIHPPTSSNGRKNVFSNFYQIVTNERWPYRSVIEITLLEILGYSTEITSECKNFFNIDLQIPFLQSLIKLEGNEVWFEMAIPSHQANILLSELPDWNLQILNLEQISTGREDWLISSNRNAISLHNYSFLRSPRHLFDQQNKNQIIQIAIDEAMSQLAPYALLPVSVINNLNPYWFFVPRINLSGQKIKWHPILSEYLISFILSSILRYQPQLIVAGGANNYFAEAWCVQSAITALRYFLMLMTDPPEIVMNQII
jgi:hypothetical protein